MSNTIRHPRNRKLRVIAVLSVVAIAMSTPVLGHDRRHTRHHHHDHYDSHRSAGHRYAGYGAVDVGHGRFVVPQRIDRRYVDDYRPYYWKRVYDRGHRHHHAVYRFPVYTTYGIVYQPYAYCGERLFHGGVHFSYHGSHVAFSIGF